jgi:hypothetical protein
MAGHHDRPAIGPIGRRLAHLNSPRTHHRRPVLPAAYNAHIIDTLGISAGDIVGLEEITLGIVEFAEEAYCPKYATGDY